VIRTRAQIKVIAMKPKQLQSELQDLRTFSNPKQNLEQYATTPLLATKLLQVASVEFNDIEEKSVIDLGVGTGVLAIGAKLMGAGHVLGIDVDADALEECKENLEMYEPELEVELCLMDVVELIRRYDNDEDEDEDEDEAVSVKRKDYVWPRADTVLTNPPFGTRRKGADVAFLAAAMKMAETAVYSFHKTSTREYIEKVAVKKLGAKSAKVVAEMKYGLKNQYGHHRKDEVEVFVDVWRIEPSSSKAKKDDDDDDDDEKDEMFEQNLRDLAANIEELQLSARQRKDKERNKNSRKNSDNRKKW
jgi:predicted RNA methylase